MLPCTVIHLGLLRLTGIEAGSGMPSKMQMLRLAAKEEFRTAAMKVVTELKNAGVDLNSAVRVSFHV
jgi:hypothetical protein